MDLTRRKYLKRTAAVAAGLAFSQLAEPALMGTAQAAARLEAAQERSGGKVSPENHPAMLYDLTKCAGCHFCEIACQMNKGIPPELAVLNFKRPPATEDPQVSWAARRHQCMHCLHPGCVSACPVAAMYKTADGPVIYRDERCFGCRYCMNACPFNVPTFDWDRGLLDGALIRKCNFCADRQAEGKRPACVEACPTGAVIFGRRSDLLALARARLAAEPDRYVNHIYGEHEAGGTGFLTISAVPFDALGLPSPGNRSLTALPDAVMGGVLPFAFAWTAVLTGVAWVARRKDRLAAKEERE